jgi:hypothetical protein
MSLSHKPLSLWNEFGTWRGFDLLFLCLGVKSRALVLNANCWKLGCLEWWWLGVFIAPTTKPTVGEGCCRWAHRTVQCAIGHCPVRQPCHPTVRVLTISTVGALTSWGTGQSGAAPDRHYSLSGAPSGAALTLYALFPCTVHFCRRPLAQQPLLCMAHWTVRCYTGQSGATPDSPVNYSGATLQKPKAEEFRVYGPWCTGHCPVRQTRAHFGFLLLLSF